MWSTLFLQFGKLGIISMLHVKNQKESYIMSTGLIPNLWSFYFGGICVFLLSLRGKNMVHAIEDLKWFRNHHLKKFPSIQRSSKFCQIFHSGGMLLTVSVCYSSSEHAMSLAETDVCPTFCTTCCSLLCTFSANHLMFTQK